MSKSSVPRPTAAELSLLRVLWRIGAADAKSVHDTLLSDLPDATYATVLRQLQVMHGKGLVHRDETLRPHRYRAAQAQEKVQSHLLKDLIAKAFDGSGKALVLAALSNSVSAKERAEIEQLLRKTGPR